MNTQQDNTIELIERNNILIVDDQVSILKPLARFMSIHNIQVEAVSKAEQAIKTIESDGKFDLVILDVLMPEISGFDLCRRIREKYTMYELPVIFITAKNQIDDIVSGFEAGGNDYIFKPFDLNELLARSRNLIKLKKLAEKNQHLQQFIDFKNRFHQMTIHDLKNPLSSIIVLSDLIKAEDTNTSHLEFLSIIQSSSQKMLDIINNYLDLHKIESGKITLKKELVDFKKLIESAVHDNSGNASIKEQMLILNGNFDSAFNVNIDRLRIEQVLDNLISNAIKYSLAGTQIKINVLFEIDKYNNKYISLDVIDSGPGFTEKDKEKLFGRFEKLSATPTGGELSTGLGLAIAKEIINLHNGTLTAENNANGIGSKLSFKIPV